MYDEDIENNGLRELIEKGREQGFITFADINDFLPEDVSDPDQLDEVIQTINDLGLQVLENAPEEGSDAMEAINQPVAPEPTENEMGAIESEVGRTTDPVRLYMREMGSVDLLTREGEIVIAKSIEEGARDLLHSCAKFPGIIEEFLLEYALIRKEDKTLRGLNFAVIDEVDSILIDEARTPLIISGIAEDNADLYLKLKNVPKSLNEEIIDVETNETSQEGDYVIDLQSNSIELTNQGHEKIEEKLRELNLITSNENLYSSKNLKLLETTPNCFKIEIDKIV